MPIQPPDSNDFVEVMSWIVAACFSAVAAMAGGFLWLISRFSQREKEIINPLTEAVESMAETTQEVVDTVKGVGAQMQVANQQEHDRQLLDSDRRRRNGD